MRLRLPLVVVALAALLQAGCAAFALSVVPGPAKDVPAALYGVAPGARTTKELKAAGWALADEKGSARTWVLAVDEPGVQEVEVQGRAGEGDALDVESVRVRYRSGRLRTYRDLVDTLVKRHGPPQESAEVVQSPLLAIEATSERPRPSRVIVHRWNGAASDLVLVAGLESQDILEASMEYQLLLVPRAR